MKGRPPVFTHSADPMEADDWLRAVEKQLNIAQCKLLGNCREQLRLGGSLIKLLVPTMLLLSLGRNFVEILEHDISMKE